MPRQARRRGARSRTALRHFRQREALLVADAYEDSRFDPTADKKTGFRTRSVMCVPLRAQGKDLGVLQVLNKHDGTSFTQRELVLLQATAALVAMALDNARKHEELVQAQRLAAVGETISSLAHCIKNVLTGKCRLSAAATMEEAVELAAEVSTTGDTVLLAPACASFDMFKNYGHRGEVFRAAVNALNE